MRGFDLYSFQKTVRDIKNSHKPFRSLCVDIIAIRVIISICVGGGYLQTRREVDFVVEQKSAYSARPPKLLDRVRGALRTFHSTTMIHTHVLNKGGHGVRSPFDGL